MVIIFWYLADGKKIQNIKIVHFHKISRASIFYKNDINIYNECLNNVFMWQEKLVGFTQPGKTKH